MKPNLHEGTVNPFDFVEYIILVLKKKFTPTNVTIKHMKRIGDMQYLHIPTKVMYNYVHR